jgi:UDP-N-acetylmuramoyl-tripeptide--D-alanyl-D-alanine ligase
MFLSDILNLIGSKIDIDKKINKIRIDSRLLNKDDVFICINSGYKYIEDAIKKEVALIITEKNNNYNTEIPIIVVDDTIKVLGIIAKYIRSKYNGKVIAITGSNGKTTTKELLCYVLDTKYKVLKSIGSINNHIGVPSTILELDNSYDYLVLEFGTNHPGEIKYLNDIAKPDIGIITNIGMSHIGNFGSLENIYKEKISIVDDNKLLFVNGEDKYLKNSNGIKVYNNEYNYDSNIPYYKMNYYLVFKVCEYLGMNIKDIINIINTFDINNSRMDIYNYGSITLIDDSYNASYESIVCGINYLDKDRRKIIILGDMLELGKYNKKLHKSIGNIISKLDNYILFTIGNNTRVIKANMHFNNTLDLINYLDIFEFKDGDLIYIKGAHSINMYKIVNYLKNNFTK